MGYIHHLLGRYEQAIAYYLRSLSLRGGKRALGARTLQRLGEAQVAAGRVAEGRQTLGRALDLVAELAPGDADALRTRIRGLAPQGGVNARGAAGPS
ncbi:hypothetical protein GCM10020220_076840 [Nonomuraea rubra]